MVGLELSSRKVEASGWKPDNFQEAERVFVFAPVMMLFAYYYRRASLGVD